ncbi:MAG: SGNH/GDSL hydrolase family protein [Thermodesulfobacteriota bacterium]
MGTQPPEEPEFDGNPLFERYVAIGDSLTHGFQSGAVDETRQPDAYPALLAEKMGTEFNQPLLKFPGYLVNIEDVLKGNISWWEYYYPLSGGKRVDGYDNQDSLNNFGVTGAAAKDGLNTTGDAGGFYELVLGESGAPMVDQAMDRDPTFVSFWLANNDVLGAALHCDTGALSTVSDFKNDFTDCVDRIDQNTEANGGSIKGAVLFNVPDVTAIAYLKDVNDPDLPAGAVNPFWMQRASESMMLSQQELDVIQDRAEVINDEIEYAAMANNWAFVDTNAIFNDIAEYGHGLKDATGVPTGETITNDYLGGLFSLDGVHPSVTGHAVAANFAIDSVNAHYGASLDPVDEVAVSENDSLYQDPVDPRGLIDGWVADAIYFGVEMFM